MTQLVNVLLAWIATGSAAACGIVWFLKKAASWSQPEGLVTWSQKWNKRLRQSHIFLGITAVQTGLFHGLLSSESVFSLNIGTLLWLLTVAIGLTFMWRKRLAQWRGWIHWHRVLTVAIGALLVVHIVDVGGITIHKVALETIMPQSMAMQSSQLSQAFTDQAASSGTYKDGVYTGEAVGYRPGLVVEVTVAQGLISDIQIVSHNEKGQRFYGPPMAWIPQAIIESQSTEVDIVSGATYTSIGIMDAVGNALESAR